MDVRVLLSLLLLNIVFLSGISAGGVTVLDPTNFDTIIDGSRPAFIEFYAPWCGHCKNLAPAYEVVGDTFAPSSSSVVVAKVDCDAHKALCSRFGVTGYPTLKWFSSNTEHEAYSGGRSAEEIVEFINEKTGLRGRVSKVPSKVIEADDITFGRIVRTSNKYSLVEFFAPWCGHCKSLAPEYEKLGVAFANEPEVQIVKVNADAHKSEAQRYGVTGFPTLIWFDKDGNTENYNGGRSLDELVSFVNEKAHTFRRSDGRLQETVGRIAELDEIAKQFVHSDEKEKLLSEVKDIIKSLPGAVARDALVYVRTAEKVISSGKHYLENEAARLENLMKGRITPTKVDEFTRRRNIIVAFSDE